MRVAVGVLGVDDHHLLEGGLLHGEAEEEAAEVTAENYMSDAVLDGDKVYFPLEPEPDYRGVAHGDCAIGIVIALAGASMVILGQKRP